MAEKIISTYTEYDENGNLKSKTVTESPYLTEHVETEGKISWTDIWCEQTAGEITNAGEQARPTPEELVCRALLQTGLVKSVDDPRAVGFWRLFQLDLRAYEYEIG